MNEKYEAAKAEFDKLSTGLKVEGEMMKVLEDGEITSEEISELEKSDNDFLKTVAKDLTEYRNKVNEFNTTYADIKGKDKTKLDEDYAAITDAGLELKKKYSEIKFEDVYKMSRDDILGFYGTIEELDKYLAEKI